VQTIVAVNASPRVGWNTSALVREAAAGAQAQSASVQIFDLYRLEKYSGCISCFGCKLAPNEGRCVCRDGLTPVLDAIRSADGLIIGSPNYLGDVSAGFRALYERLIFQSLTYRKEQPSCNGHMIPVLLLMTSNTPKEFYAPAGYSRTLRAYQKSLDTFVGKTKLLIAGDTLQVKDYSRFHWTMFDASAKAARYEKEFPAAKEKAFRLGAQMVTKPWN